MIGCGEDVNNMFCNHLYEFGTNFEDPNNISSILGLFDNAWGMKFMSMILQIQNIFFMKNSTF